MERTEPKTLLGFLLAVVTVVAAAAVAVSTVLVVRGYVLTAGVAMGVAFAMVVGVLVWVMRIHARNPTALLLGHVTATDYLAVQRWTAGDSTAGVEERELVMPGTEALVAAPRALELGPGDVGSTDGDEDVSRSGSGA
jgi:hypothetical protein